MGNASTRPVPCESSPGEEVSEETKLPESPPMALRMNFLDEYVDEEAKYPESPRFIPDEEDDAAEEQSVPSAKGTEESEPDLSPKENSYWSDSEKSRDYSTLNVPAAKSHKPNLPPKQLDSKAGREQRHQAFPLPTHTKDSILPEKAENTERRYVLPRMQKKATSTSDSTYLPWSQTPESKRAGPVLPPRRPDETIEQWIDRMIKSQGADSSHGVNIPNQPPGETMSEWANRMHKEYVKLTSSASVRPKYARVAKEVDSDTEENITLEKKFAETIELLKKLSTDENSSKDAPTPEVTPAKRPFSHHHTADSKSEGVEPSKTTTVQEPNIINTGSKHVKGDEQDSKRRRMDKDGEIGKAHAQKQPSRKSQHRSKRHSKRPANTSNKADEGSGSAAKRGTIKESTTKAAPSKEATGKGVTSDAVGGQKAESKETNAKRAAIRARVAERLARQEGPTKEAAAKVPKASNAPQKRTSDSFLRALPFEIRLLIYRQMLTTPKTVRGGELVTDKQHSLIIPSNRPAIFSLGIDATFLRTCKQIYLEALPVLYQNNTFGFSEVQMIETFKRNGLQRASCKFAFPPPSCQHHSTNSKNKQQRKLQSA